MKIEGRRWHVHLEWHGRDYGDEEGVGLPALGALIFLAVSVGLFTNPAFGALVMAAGLATAALVDLVVPIKPPVAPAPEDEDEPPF